MWAFQSGAPATTSTQPVCLSEDMCLPDSSNGRWGVLFFTRCFVRPQNMNQNVWLFARSCVCGGSWRRGRLIGGIYFNGALVWGASPACRPAIDRSNFSYHGLRECALVWVRRAQGVALHVCDAQFAMPNTIGHWQLLSVSHFRTIWGRVGSGFNYFYNPTHTFARTDANHFSPPRRSLTHVRTYARKFFLNLLSYC